MNSDLDDLQEKIKKVRQDAAEPQTEIPVSNAASEGMRAASEFLGYVVAGILFGYLLDTYAGTSPFGIIALPILGLATGVYRANQAMNNKDNKQ